MVLLATGRTSKSRVELVIYIYINKISMFVILNDSKCKAATAMGPHSKHKASYVINQPFGAETGEST